MAQNHRFPKNELLRYAHQPEFVSGEEYLIVMGSIYLGSPKKQADYALGASRCRDGLEAFLINEDPLRKRKTDKDLCWIITDEGDGKVALQSVATKKYLSIDGHTAVLSRKKQLISVRRSDTLYRFYVTDKDGTEYFLHAARREEAATGINFTSGTVADKTTFGLFRRVTVDLSPKPAGKPLVTAGTYADVHIDNGLQNRPPYLRKSILKTARKYRKNFDLDALIMCGDNISDNASWLDGTGAPQGYWSYEKWQRSRKCLDEALRSSFKNPENSGNILYLTGNHDYQVGDRECNGNTYNSAYYTDLLPEGITHPLYQQMDVKVGPTENLLCYQYRIKDVHFLVLNEPAYPFYPGCKWPGRGDPGHSLEQAEWLEARLKEIEEELGNKAVVFVSSHFPFSLDSFSATYGACPPNHEAFARMTDAMCRFPNLFYVYGHVHCDDIWITHTHSAETVDGICPAELKLEDNGEYLKAVVPENSERAKFRSDVLLPSGFHHVFGGSLSFCGTRYFANNGKKVRSDLTDIEVPFYQVMVAEVYTDRVVLTMHNFGTKKDLLACMPFASHKLKPLVCPLVK